LFYYVDFYYEKFFLSLNAKRFRAIGGYTQDNAL
jgi:hypothetical protein